MRHITPRYLGHQGVDDTFESVLCKYLNCTDDVFSSFEDES